MYIYIKYKHARISYAFSFSFFPIVCGRVASDNRPHFYPRFFLLIYVNSRGSLLARLVTVYNTTVVIFKLVNM